MYQEATEKQIEQIADPIPQIEEETQKIEEIADQIHIEEEINKQMEIEDREDKKQQTPADEVEQKPLIDDTDEPEQKIICHEIQEEQEAQVEKGKLWWQSEGWTECWIFWFKLQIIATYYTNIISLALKGINAYMWLEIRFNKMTLQNYSQIKNLFSFYLFFIMSNIY